MPDSLRVKNRRILLALTVIVAGMIGMSYAAVPLYDLFCRVTGFGGTTQVASAPSAKTADRIIKIRFDASLSNSMPWKFQPVQREMSLRVGKTGIAFYRAENQSEQTLVGTATFNVTPLKAGIYFSKIDCFCFVEQTLQPGERVKMPVTFYIDPEINENIETKNIKSLTLSYTFYKLEDEIKS